MVSACCVYGCPGAVPVHGATSFRFPVDDPRRLAEWCERLQIAADCEQLYDLNVCHRHFSPEQCDLTTDCKNRLKVNAVPDRRLPKGTTSSDDSKTSNFQRCPTDDGFNPPVLVLDDLDKVCRLCLEVDEQETHESIFAKVDLVDFILQSIGIGIEENDGFPQMICQTCIERVTYIHRSREWFHKNDQFLKDLVGELSSQKALPTHEPIGSEEGNSILPDEELIKEESHLEREDEAILDQMSVPAGFQQYSDEEHHSRKRRRAQRKKKRSDGDEVTSIPHDSLDRFCSSQKATLRRFRCDCGASYLKEARFNAHLLKEHDGRGVGKAMRPKVPANPLVLEEMAAVFNRIKTQSVVTELNEAGGYDENG